jgi:hypothetical protein
MWQPGQKDKRGRGEFVKNDDRNVKNPFYSCERKNIAAKGGYPSNPP